MTKFLDVQFVLICDDVRNEEGGKQTIVGLYGNEMILPRGTSTLVAPIAFFIRGKFTGVAPTPIQLWIEDPNGTKSHEVEWSPEELASRVCKAGQFGQLVWKVLPWQSTCPATHRIHLAQDGVDEVIGKIEVRNAPN